jgi:hypothetical protein
MVSFSRTPSFLLAEAEIAMAQKPFEGVIKLDVRDFKAD